MGRWAGGSSLGHGDGKVAITVMIAHSHRFGLANLIPGLVDDGSDALLRVSYPAVV
jgi:hypothetical protein